MVNLIWYSRSNQFLLITNHLYFSTKLVAKSKDASGASNGAQWPALLMIRSSNKPADLTEPTILSFIFHPLKRDFPNY